MINIYRCRTFVWPNNMYMMYITMFLLPQRGWHTNGTSAITFTSVLLFLKTALRVPQHLLNGFTFKITSFCTFRYFSGFFDLLSLFHYIVRKFTRIPISWKAVFNKVASFVLITAFFDFTKSNVSQTVPLSYSVTLSPKYPTHTYIHSARFNTS